MSGGSSWCQQWRESAPRSSLRRLLCQLSWLLFVVATALDIAMRSSLCAAAAAAAVETADVEAGTVPPQQQQYSQPPPQCYAKDSSKTAAAAGDVAFQHSTACAGAYAHSYGDQFNS